MICEKCRKGKHKKCANGPLIIGTHCFCQHRKNVANYESGYPSKAKS